MSANLPSGFEALEPFLAKWKLPDSEARCRMRQSSSMQEIRDFYDGVAPLAERAVTYLQEIELGEMAPEAENLLKLMLSLAEVGPAVEWYGQQQVYDGFDVMKLRWTRQIPDMEKQFK